MTADIPSVLSKDGTDGLGAVPSVLEESRTVDNTGIRDYRSRSILSGIGWLSQSEVHLNTRGEQADTHTQGRFLQGGHM